MGYTGKQTVIIPLFQGVTVPAYDFLCHDCRRRVTLRFKSTADYAAAMPACPHCGSTRLARRIKRVRVLRGDEARLAGLGDDAALDDLENADPATMGRLMRQMAAETGEDPGDEFHEFVGRLEKGEDPEQIAASMPELADEVGFNDAGGAEDPF
jgi:putative FmdB family regulatory protein